MVAMSDPVMPSYNCRGSNRELGPVLEDLKVLLTALGFSAAGVLGPRNEVAFCLKYVASCCMKGRE